MAMVEEGIHLGVSERTSFTVSSSGGALFSEGVVVVVVGVLTQQPIVIIKESKVWRKCKRKEGSNNVNVG